MFIYATILMETREIMKDYALIATAYDQHVRFYVSTTKNLVEHARKIHQTWPTATAASAMMGLMYKGDESLTISIKGDGPIGSMLVEANAKGEVRGDIANPNVYIKYEDGPKKGKLNVGTAVGRGLLHVTKDLQMKSFFTSSSELQTGEIAEDFTYYLATSEQVPSSVGLGVLVDTDQSVLASGGFILQLMPGCPENVIAKIEKKISQLPPVTSMLNKQMTIEEMLSLLADNTENILAKTPLDYTCNCSKESLSRSLSALDDKTLDELIFEDEHAEIKCHFCHTVYHFSAEELMKIKLSRKKK